VDENQISYQVIGAALEVHRQLGPGLLESVYRQCLSMELSLRGIPVKDEIPITASYKGMILDAAYRLDMVIDGRVIVELKTVERLLPVHHAQLLSYLRLTGMKLGLLINFNVTQLRTGVRRIVNDL